MQLKYIYIVLLFFQWNLYGQCPDKAVLHAYLDTCKNLAPLEGLWQLNAVFQATPEQSTYFPLIAELAILKVDDRYQVCNIKNPDLNRFFEAEIYLYETARRQHFYLSIQLDTQPVFVHTAFSIPNTHYFSAGIALPVRYLYPYFPNIRRKVLDYHYKKMKYNTVFEFLKQSPKLPVTAHSANRSGTAFVVDAKNGYLVTNAHYIGEKDRIILTHFKDGKLLKYKAKLITKDLMTNLALLKIDDTTFLSFRALQYHFDSAMHEEKDVFMLGFPQEKLLLTDVPCLLALVGKTRKSGFVPLEYGQVLPGYGGSPLIDNYGNIRGVAVGGEAQNRTEESYMLHVEELKTFLIENQININKMTQASGKKKVYPAIFSEHILFVESFEN